MRIKQALLFTTITVVAIFSIIISNSISKNTENRSLAAPANKIYFPKDHVFHKNFSREWWYVNLLIRTADKETRDTGYVISFGKIDNKSALLTSKYDRYDDKFVEKTNYSGKVTTTLGKTNLLTVSFTQKNGSNLILKELPPLKNGGKQYSLKGNTLETETFDLVLTEKTVNKKGYNTPLLWGCNGNISVFSPHDTFYYSIPDLDITGTIKSKDGAIKKVEVGKAWMDHQWFNPSPPTDWLGHYWSSLHLTKRTDFLGPHTAIGAVTQIFKTGPKYSYWVKRNLDGTNECGTNVQFEIENKYNNKYPSGLRINITNSKKQTVYSGLIKSFSKNQIFTSSGKEFFEPMSYTSGTLGKNENTGLGFFETAIK